MHTSRKRSDRGSWAGLALSLMAAAAGSVVLAIAASAQPKQPEAPPAPGACVDVRGEASFASVGYDHLVHLKNNCKKRAACTVKTDVNPEVVNVELAPGESKTLVTWRGSPAREFKVEANCLEK